MEAIKLVVGECPSYSRRLLIFDGYSGAFRVVSLRPKQSGCAVCGDTPTITDLERVDYVRFCGRGPTDKVNLITFRLSVPPPHETNIIKDFVRFIQDYVAIALDYLGFFAVNQRDTFELFKDRSSSSHILWEICIGILCSSLYTY